MPKDPPLSPSKASFPSSTPSSKFEIEKDNFRAVLGGLGSETNKYRKPISEMYRPHRIPVMKPEKKAFLENYKKNFF